MLDAPTLDITENYMVSNFQSDLRMNSGITVKGTALRESMHANSLHLEVALLDSATTHMILQDPFFFHLPAVKPKPGKYTQCTL